MDTEVSKWLKDPEFLALPDKVKAEAIGGYFVKNYTDEEYFKAPPAIQQEAANGFINEHLSTIPQPKRTLGGTLGDIGVSTAKGIVGAGEAAVGLADIPTLGLAGKALETVFGYDPKKTQETLSSLYSAPQQKANLEVEQAKGFFGKASAALQNPSTIGHSVIESAPSMLGGAGIARGLLQKGVVAAPVIAGAIGEGLVGAGSSAEQMRQESQTGALTPQQSISAVGSGAGTAAFALAGGRIAQKLGFADVDTMLAGGGIKRGTGNIAKRIIGGGISEGVFEELPQSAQEQIWLNAALNRPILQDVPEAGAQGMLAGAVMGGGANLFARGAPAKETPPPVQPPIQEQPSKEQPQAPVQPQPEPAFGMDEMVNQGVMPEVPPAPQQPDPTAQQRQAVIAKAMPEEGSPFQRPETFAVDIEKSLRQEFRTNIQEATTRQAEVSRLEKKAGIEEAPKVEQPKLSNQQKRRIEDEVFERWKVFAQNRQYTEAELRAAYKVIEDEEFQKWKIKAQAGITPNIEPQAPLPEAPLKMGQTTAAPAQFEPPKPFKSVQPKEPTPGMATTLRGRIRQMGGINFMNFTGELRSAPTAVQYLSKKNGVPIDLAVQRLTEEGWLSPGEDFLELVRSDPEALRRGNMKFEGAKQDRFKTEKEKQVEKDMAYEPEEPPKGEYVTLNAEDLPEGKKVTLIDNKSVSGWDVYEVQEKDPFSILLKDGKTVELRPLDKVQVLKADLQGKAPKVAVTGKEAEAKTPESIASTLGVKYDGEYGVPEGQEKAHSFTATEGPAKGGSFTVRGEVTADKVKAALGEIEKQREKPAPKPVVPEGKKAEKPAQFSVESDRAKGEAGQFATSRKKPWHITSKDYETIFPVAGKSVDGRIVLPDVPNTDSIESSVDNATVVKGIREIPLSAFEDTDPPVFASASEERRTKDLAVKIKASNEIAPLIVVYDSKGPYVLEGGHRFDALKILNAKSLPAMVVFDEDSLYDAVKTATETGEFVPKDILAEYPEFSRTKGQFATSSNTFEQLTPAKVKSLFEKVGQESGIHSDGTIWVKTRGGFGFTVELVDHISASEAEFKLAYGRLNSEGRPIAGRYKDGKISIVPGIGDSFTLRHEEFHLLEDFGLFKDEEIAALNAKLKREGIESPGKEDRAKWVEDNLYSRSLARGYQRILQKVRDFIDSFVNLFKATSRGVLRGMESGKFMSRSLPDSVNEFAQAESLSVKEAAKNVMENPAFKKWFGKSVVTESKSPKIVYHGTGDEFEVFQSRGAVLGRLWGNGFYFTEAESDAKHWAELSGKRTGLEMVMPVYISIQNPLYLESGNIIEGLPDDFKSKLIDQIGEDDPDLASVLSGETFVEDFEVEKYAKEIAAYAKDFGYDGIIGTYDGNEHYLVFKPTQIKSIYNRGSFSTTDPNILHSQTAERWYSQMERFLSAKLPGSGTPESIKATLKAWADKGEFKAEELQWSGVNEFLDSRQGKVTKAEVLGYLRENNVRVEEVVKGSALTAPEKKRLAALSLNSDRTEVEDAEFAELVDKSNTGTTSKFSSYATPGGENYREMLITLPVKERADKYQLVRPNGDVFQTFDSLEEAQRNHELFPSYQLKTLERAGEGAFRSSHYDEPNILVHIRFDEREDSEGRRVVHVAEVQSDWHQKGRKEGYDKKWYRVVSKGGTGNAFEGADGHETKASAEAAIKKYIEDQEMKGYGVYARNRELEIITDTVFHKATPDAPFKTAWPLLAMKRMVRWASENGFDGITWDPGTVQAERYDLSKQIDELKYRQRKDGKYSIQIFKDGTNISQPARIPDAIEPERLEDYVGKDVAQKILGGGGNGTLSGLDLRVGDKGMVGFYDKILPAELNKFFGKAKWGKARVGETTIETSKLGGGKISQFRKQAKEPISEKPWVAVDDKKGVVGQFATKEEASKSLDRGVGSYLQNLERPIGTSSVPFLPITPEMRRLSLSEGMPLFAQQRVDPIISEKFAVPEEKTWASAIKGAFETSTWTREAAKEHISNLRTLTIDRLHPIEQLGRTPYLLHRMLGNAHLVISTFLQHGKLSWKDNALTVTTKNEGFLPWLKKMDNDGRNLFYWMAAKRAERLESQDRENWLDQASRDKIYDSVFKGLSPTERANKEREFSQLNREFQTWNRNILEIARQAGLLNQDQIDAFMKDYYLPFYRLLEDEATREEFLRSPRKSKKHISAQIKRLKGGTEKIGDPIENILRNWSHLIQESQRNMARSAAADVAVPMRLAEEVPKSELTKILGSQTTKQWGVRKPGNERATKIFDAEADAQAFIAANPSYEMVEQKKTTVMFGRKEDFQIVSYQKEGETVYLRVTDPALFEAMAEVNVKMFDSGLMKILSGAKRLLTAGATFSPAFRIANLLRDTLHTAVVSKSFVPFVDSARGLVKTWNESPEYIELMASGGGFGKGWVESGDPSAMARSIEKILKREGEGAKGRLLDTPRKMLAFWERIGHASEMAARVQLYSNLKAKGMPHLESAFEAKDLLDFHVSGAANSVRVLNATVPFVNARIQGLDRLYRGAKDNPMAFMAKGALVAGASLMLWGLFKDDDRYKELEDWDKWQYHHFWIGDQHFRLPKAFEIGAIFSSLFETSASVLDGQEDWKFFRRFLAHTLTETFSFSPPAAFAPTIEVYANKSFFTGRPIENLGMQKLPPGERSRPWTPEVLKALGEGLNISPVKMESIIRGHTATFGTMFLTTADAFYRFAVDVPERPSSRIQDYPAIGRFVRNEGSTKYATRYYDFAKEVEELAATVNNYKLLGEIDKAKTLAKDSMGKLKYKKFIGKVNKALSGIRRQEKQVWMSDMTSEEKRERLDKIQTQKNAIYKKAYGMIYESR